MKPETAKSFYASNVKVSPYDAYQMFLENFEQGSLAVFKKNTVVNLMPQDFVLRNFIDAKPASLLSYDGLNISTHGQYLLDTGSTGIIMAIDAVVLRKRYGQHGEYEKQKLTTKEFPSSQLKIVSCVHVFLDNKEYLVTTRNFVSQVFVTHES